MVLFLVCGPVMGSQPVLGVPYIGGTVVRIHNFVGGISGVHGFRIEEVPDINKSYQ